MSYSLRYDVVVVSAISKAVSVLKREGWNGLKRRVFSDHGYSEWIQLNELLSH